MADLDVHLRPPPRVSRFPVGFAQVMLGPTPPELPSILGVEMATWLLISSEFHITKPDVNVLGTSVCRAFAVGLLYL
jgi:hypothetical protein